MMNNIGTCVKNYEEGVKILRHKWKSDNINMIVYMICMYIL